MKKSLSELTLAPDRDRSTLSRSFFRIGTVSYLGYLDSLEGRGLYSNLRDKLAGCIPNLAHQTLGETLLHIKGEMLSVDSAISRDPSCAEYKLACEFVYYSMVYAFEVAELSGVYPLPSPYDLLDGIPEYGFEDDIARYEDLDLYPQDDLIKADLLGEDGSADDKGDE